MLLISNRTGDVANRKYTRLSGKCRYANGEQSTKPSSLAISKEARKAAFDRRRSKSIAAAMTQKKSGSKSESDDSDISSDSEDEYSDDESDSSSDESSDSELIELLRPQQLYLPF